MAGENTTVAEGDAQVAPQGDRAITPTPVVETYTKDSVAALKVESVPVRADSRTLNLDSSIYRTEALADNDSTKRLLTPSGKEVVPSQEPVKDSLMDRLLKDNKDKPAVHSDYLNPNNQLEIFKRSGMSADQAADFQRDILKRLADRGDKLDGTPEQQLARITQALDAILDPTKAGAGADALKRMSPPDRANLVKDFLMRMSNPEAFVNQGAHNTCALTSMQKLALQGNDPAKLAEQLAGVVNNGFTFVKDASTPTGMRRVDVHSSSLIPDQESSQDPTKNAENRRRSMAGHAMDALFGQIAADNQGVIDGKKYVYLAGHAGDFTGGSRSSTGEGLFEADQRGNPTRFVDDSPQMTLVAKLQLSQALGLPDKINFVHASMQNEIPEHLRKHFSIFNDVADLKAQLRKFNGDTGMNVAELRVNAPFLPGENMAGHGLHSVNIRFDGQEIKIDNHWGDGKDQTLSDAQLKIATDASQWGNFPRQYRPGQPNTPGNIIEAPSKSLRLPNETDDAYAKRIEQLRAEQEQASKQRLEQLEKDKAKVAPTPDNHNKRLELQNDIDNAILVRDAYKHAFEQFQSQFNKWMSENRRGDEPNLMSIINSELGGIKFK